VLHSDKLIFYAKVTKPCEIQTATVVYVYILSDLIQSAFKFTFLAWFFLVLFILFI